MSYKKESIDLHRKKRGKIEIKPKISLKRRHDLCLAYTPGVAEVCQAIKDDIKQTWKLTNRANTVAIVSDGSAILGLGNIGPEAGMPVMEGKSVLFKKFAGIDAYPLCISSSGVKEVVQFCRSIAPSVAGINLEDISAPNCFEVLETLEKELDIPVFHDDQDGTAIATLAALINACKVTNKRIKDLKVVVNGAGAAGIAIARLLLNYGVKDLKLLDSVGLINNHRKDLNRFKQEFINTTNKGNIQGRLEEALPGTDVFIGVSQANILTEEMIDSMNPEPIIFAMANPAPEICPKKARKTKASVVGTGNSDCPNQINNALVFPGIFRGLLDAKVMTVTPEIKIKAALALSKCLKKPHRNKILPRVTDTSVVKAIARQVRN